MVLKRESNRPERLARTMSCPIPGIRIALVSARERFKAIVWYQPSLKLPATDLRDRLDLDQEAGLDKCR